jgi:hypothetical protein
VRAVPFPPSANLGLSPLFAVSESTEEIMRRLCLSLACLATAICLPSWAVAGDTDAAERIVNVMERSGALEIYDVSVRVSQRTAYLRGTVRNEQQLATAIEIAQASPDIDRVVSDIKIAADAEGAARQPVASYVAPASNSTDASLPTAPARAPQQPSKMPMPAAASAAQQPARLAQAPPARLMNQGAAAMGGPRQLSNGMPHPAYVPGAGAGPRAAYDQPALPGYAWPTYAAYPNYAALTYPKQYSATAWPYIGPFYPYPQVPLGWRKVTLEWDDGWWFLDFKD